MKIKMQNSLRLLSLLLALLMLCSLLLVSCKKDDEGTDDDGTNPPAGTTATPKTVTEKYMPESVVTSLTDMLENQNVVFNTLQLGAAPYAIRDVYAISDCKLLSMTLPVMKTGKKDGGGNFTLTLFVVLNSYQGLKEAPIEKYEIKISASQYDLPENTSDVRRMIKVDLSSYDIRLSKKTTIAVLDTYDTIFPACLSSEEILLTEVENAAQSLLKKDFPDIMGWWEKVGTEDRKATKENPSLILDFEYERTYESEEAYNAVVKAEQDYQNMVAELKTLLQGKTYSVIGDSISTFEGYNNDPNRNSTTTNNNVYYNDLKGVPGDADRVPSRNFIFDSYQDTYWGRLTKELGMELCVNNAWSGSYVYETTSARYKQNMYARSNQLHRDNGTPDDKSDDVTPDVIIVFMSTNDMLHKEAATSDKNLSSELHKLSNTTMGVMEKWFAKVKAVANAAPEVQQGVAYTTWEAGYALSLELMQKTYPDAEIVCLTLPRCNHTNSTETLVTMFNEHIRALATYFGATIVETGEALPYETCHAYGSDSTTVHPNVLGHKKMFEGIVKAMYADKAKFAPAA